MIVQIDTREHQRELKRIQSQFDAIGQKYIRSKLYCGDYMSLDNAKLVIDRKKGLLEVCQNVTQQHARFRAELERARDAGIQIVLLIENFGNIQSIEDVKTWQNPRKHQIRWRYNKTTHKRERYVESPKAIDGPQLYKSLCTIRDRYGVQLEFCKWSDTGQRIVEILSNDRPGD